MSVSTIFSVGKTSEHKKEGKYVKLGKLKTVFLFFAMFMAWYIVGQTSNQLFIPSVESVVEMLKKLWTAETLQKAASMSFYRITIATAASFLISVPLGLLVVTFKWVDDIIVPLTGAMRFLPVTAFSPLLILWLGIDEPMKIVFLFFAIFVYFLPTVILTLKSADKEVIEVALTSDISKAKLMRYVYLPYCAPALCKSFLMMYGIGWTYIVVAENINAVHGLGHLILIGSARGNTSMVFAGLVTIIFISVIFDVVGNLIIKNAFKWYFREE